MTDLLIWMIKMSYRIINWKLYKVNIIDGEVEEAWLVRLIPKIKINIEWWTTK